MKPPICDFCNERFELMGENAGGLVTFLPTEDDQRQLARLRQPGFVGHPPNQEWFCPKHVEQARALAHLTLGEALRTMRAQAK
jgi:hypothetical protein